MGLIYAISPVGEIQKVEWQVPDEFQLECVLPDGKGGLFLLSATETRRLEKGKKRCVSYAKVGSSAGAATLGQDGRLYIASAGRVHVVTPDRQVSIAAQGLEAIYGVAVDSRGRLYVSDWKTGNVYRLAAGTKKVLARGLDHPSGIVLDRAARLYVKESGRQEHRDLRIRRISDEGEVQLFAEVDSISRWRKKSFRETGAATSSPLGPESDACPVPLPKVRDRP